MVQMYPSCESSPLFPLPIGERFSYVAKKSSSCVQRRTELAVSITPTPRASKGGEAGKGVRAGKADQGGKEKLS